MCVYIYLCVCFLYDTQKFSFTLFILVSRVWRSSCLPSDHYPGASVRPDLCPVGSDIRSQRDRVPDPDLTRQPLCRAVARAACPFRLRRSVGCQWGHVWPAPLPVPRVRARTQHQHHPLSWYTTILSPSTIPPSTTHKHTHTSLNDTSFPHSFFIFFSLQRALTFLKRMKDTLIFLFNLS